MCDVSDIKNKQKSRTKSEFKQYNLSRSSTLESTIDKYGENLGMVKWNNYIEKQKITKSKEYVVKKHGIEFWNELCL